MENNHILISKHIDQDGYVVFLTTTFHFSTVTTNYPTPTECNNNTILTLPVVSQIPQIRGLNLPSIPMTATSGVPKQPTLLPVQFRSHNPLRINNSLEQLLELRKVVYLLLQFIIKDKNEQPDEQVHT